MAARELISTIDFLKSTKKSPLKKDVPRKTRLKLLRERATRVVGRA